ncbi:MAG: hypothetical protein H6Q14_608 [Bacteroidetes bacterium]|jgi:diacylglycerol kinase (ATP)|nr:hypothetical protein [Bacteroidota bacterium]
MQKTKIYVIINPISGVGSKKSIPERLSSQIDQQRFDLHFFITGYPGHANDIAQEAVHNKVKYVIAVGGDGTVNEVARALVGSDSVLGIIPFGSGNGLARDLKISTHIGRAIKTLKSNNICQIDYGVANDHIFFCTFGMGFDAMVSESFSKETVRGPLTYFKNVIERYIDFEPEEYEVSVKGNIIKEKAFLITCANATQYGNNAFIAPRASLQDGLMNIAILKPFGVLEIPQTTIQLFSKNIDSNKNLTEIITNEAVIKRKNPGWIHIDGDPFYEDAEVRVRIVPKGLKVIIP